MIKIGLKKEIRQKNLSCLFVQKICNNLFGFNKVCQLLKRKKKQHVHLDT
jgi:hypothetical protein